MAYKCKIFLALNTLWALYRCVYSFQSYLHKHRKENRPAKQGIHKCVIDDIEEIYLPNAWYICILLLSSNPTGILALFPAFVDVLIWFVAFMFLKFLSGSMYILANDRVYWDPTTAPSTCL